MQGTWCPELMWQPQLGRGDDSAQGATMLLQDAGCSQTRYCIHTYVGTTSFGLTVIFTSGLRARPPLPSGPARRTFSEQSIFLGLGILCQTSSASHSKQLTQGFQGAYPARRAVCARSVPNKRTCLLYAQSTTQAIHVHFQLGTGEMK